MLPCGAGFNRGRAPLHLDLRFLDGFVSLPNALRASLSSSFLRRRVFLFAINICQLKAICVYNVRPSNSPLLIERSSRQNLRTKFRRIATIRNPRNFLCTVKFAQFCEDFEAIFF
jgi:hypothetical protein